MASTREGVRIIGATFASHADAERASEALEEIGILPCNIQVVVQLSADSAGDLYSELLAERGFEADVADEYAELIRNGRTLVAVYEVVDPAPVIDILDEFKAEFNPDGSRNVRDDVVGMTAGAIAGAAALGVAGAVAGGPVGAAVGAAAGAMLGGGSGAAVGKAVEHRK